MKKKYINPKTGGYMTVEASLLFPVVVFVISFLIYLGFYVYDETISFHQCYTAALNAVSFYGSDNQRIYNRAADRLHNKAQFIALKSHEDEILVAGNQISISCQGTVQVPFSGIEIFPTGEEFWSYEVTAVSQKKDPVFWVRQAEKLDSWFQD